MELVAELLSGRYSPREAWEGLVLNPWFQETLDRHARFNCFRTRKLYLIEDVKQEVVWAIGNKLKEGKLRYEASRGQLANWLRTILRNLCLEALRRLTSRNYLYLSLTVDLEEENDQVVLDEEIACLGEEERKIMELVVQGHSLKEVSQLLEFSYSKTTWLYRRSLVKLASLLQGD